MSTMDKARKLLKERGVRYVDHEDGHVSYSVGDMDALLSEYKGKLCLTMQDFVTPEQAIRATLARFGKKGA